MITVTCDPTFDLSQAGYCTCEWCIKAFKAAYKESFEDMDFEEEGAVEDDDDEDDDEGEEEEATEATEVELVFTSYGSTHEHNATSHMSEEEADRARDLWQEIHDATPWEDRVHAAHLEGDVVADIVSVEKEEDIPEGYLRLEGDPCQLDCGVEVRDGVIFVG